MPPNDWLFEEAVIFTPQGETAKVSLHRHPHSFPFSDPWGIGARTAWAKYKTGNKVVVFLGVGAGAEVVQVIQNRQTPKVIILNDVVGANVVVCQHNVSHIAEIRKDRLEIIPAVGRAEEILEGDIFGNDCRPDLIVGCLPQVPSHWIPDDEEIAHIYPVSDYPEMAEWGFGLLFAVLVASQKTLGRHGKVSLVVSGRIPWKATTELFRNTGFEPPRIVHRFMVRHHLGTPLVYLQNTEGSFLFRDREAREAVSPLEAERERLKVGEGSINPPLNIYHWVFVVESVKR